MATKRRWRLCAHHLAHLFRAPGKTWAHDLHPQQEQGVGHLKIPGQVFLSKSFGFLTWSVEILHTTLTKKKSHESWRAKSKLVQLVFIVIPKTKCQTSRGHNAF